MIIKKIKSDVRRRGAETAAYIRDAKRARNPATPSAQKPKMRPTALSTASATHGKTPRGKSALPSGLMKATAHQWHTG